MKKNKGILVLLIVSTLILNFSNRTSAQTYPEMVKVTGGTFTMGDEWGVGNFDELPLHSVTLKSFSIAKTETTVMQWRTFCDATGHTMPETPSWGWNDNDPIVNVNWDEAVAYCDWLSDKSGQLYRLPTEAEYEYAARGGNLSKGFKYSGSQSLDMSGWYKDNSGGHPNPVATKRANELGLYDMSGNVREWCSDWYDPDYYQNSPLSNPKGPATSTRMVPSRVVRGGGWWDGATDCRVAGRGGGALDNPTFLGFRVVTPE